MEQKPSNQDQAPEGQAPLRLVEGQVPYWMYGVMALIAILVLLGPRLREPSGWLLLGAIVAGLALLVWLLNKVAYRAVSSSKTLYFFIFITLGIFTCAFGWPFLGSLLQDDHLSWSSASWLFVFFPLLLLAATLYYGYLWLKEPRKARS